MFRELYCTAACVASTWRVLRWQKLFPEGGTKSFILRASAHLWHCYSAMGFLELYWWPVLPMTFTVAPILQQLLDSRLDIKYSILGHGREQILHYLETECSFSKTAAPTNLITTHSHYLRKFQKVAQEPSTCLGWSGNTELYIHGPIRGKHAMVRGDCNTFVAL